MSTLQHPRSGEKVSSLLTGAQNLAKQGASEADIDRWLLEQLQSMAREGERSIGIFVPQHDHSGAELLN